MLQKPPTNYWPLGDVHQEEGTYPNGTHICEIEIDPETGEAKIARYVAVEILELSSIRCCWPDKSHGGLAQGIAQA